MIKACDLLDLPVFLILPKVLSLWCSAMSFFSDLPPSLRRTCLYRPFRTGASRVDIDRMLSSIDGLKAVRGSVMGWWKTKWGY